MDSRDVLLVSSDRGVLDRLPGILARRSELTVVPVARVVDALQQIALRDYRNAVCVVESSDELACIIRIKKAKPGLPVVMLTASENLALRILGEQMGADVIVRSAEGLERTADLLATAMQTRALATRQREHLAESAALIRDIRRLGDETRELIQKAMGLAAAVQPGDFVTLIVEDEPSDLLLLIQALRKAGLPPYVRAVNSVPAAIAYLSGEGAHSNRSESPVPSLIISDLNLGKESGLDLLRWVRRESSLSHLGFILFTSSESEDDMKEAAFLNANLYILKSPRLGALVDVVRSVYEYSRRYKTP